jgi:hypothetical protein
MREHWSYRLSVASVSIATAASIILMGVLWRSLPPAVPLWFSQPWGTDQLAHPLWLLLLPAGGIAVFLANTTLARLFISDHPTFIRILLLTSTLVSAGSFIALAQILMLVV